MGYGVFIHRSDSIYDDSPAERYQFPSQYLGRVQSCVGDWIVYYEPRKVAETRGYFAMARVEKIVPDPSAPGMYLALIEPGSYLDFSNPVPFTNESGVIERGLLNEQGKISGRAQSAVRPLSSLDFQRIVMLGLKDGEPLLPRVEGNRHCRALATSKRHSFSSRTVSDRISPFQESCGIASFEGMCCGPIRNVAPSAVSA